MCNLLSRDQLPYAYSLAEWLIHDSECSGPDEGLSLAALDMAGSLEEEASRMHTAFLPLGQNGTALGQFETASGQDAAAIGQDGDVAFIQNIFSCPISKVRSQLHTCTRHVAPFEGKIRLHRTCH
jgi:hypothetical protein